MVSFFALQRYFVLNLIPGSPVLSKNFQALAVDGEGKATSISVNTNNFYKGFLNGNPLHGVDAVYVDDLWLAQIYAHNNDVYSIEPLSHYDPAASRRSVLLFREKDMKKDVNEDVTSQLFCEEVQTDARIQSLTTPLVEDFNGDKKNSNKSEKKNENDHEWTNNEDVPIKLSSRRETSLIRSERDFINNRYNSRISSLQKRSNISRIYDTCDILAIADYETYKGIGKSSVSRVILVLIYIYQTADRIFRQTVFGDLTHMGLMVTKLLVHTKYSTTSDKHYNMANNIMTGTETLISLTKVSEFSGFCLGHVTTQRNFGGTLGLAATAEIRLSGWYNGICARQTNQSRNIGLTTVINANNDLLPLLVSHIFLSAVLRFQKFSL